MKTLHSPKVLVYLILIFLGSCSNDNEEELFGPLDFNCDPLITTFSDVIKPIIDTNCAVKGCHVSGPQLLPDFTVFANIQSYSDKIKELTAIRDMPRGGRVLTTEQILQIACWVDNGAQNN